MTIRFNPQHGLIVVRVLVTGAEGAKTIRLALDTGATSTLINTAILVNLGYDPVAPTRRIQMTTGSGVEFVPVLTVSRLAALGEEQLNFHVVAHTLPPSASVDGLLGLDFLRDRDLTISFRRGIITLD